MSTQTINNIISSRFFAFISFAFLTITNPTSASELPIKCYLYAQLNLELNSMNTYKTKVAEVRAISHSYNSDQLLNPVKIKGSHGETIHIDELSYECITCHDGTSASKHTCRFKHELAPPERTIDSLKSHPIGMHYGNAAYIKKNLRSISEVDQTLNLVGGLVGCVSCHDITSDSEYHLAVDNRGSNLCIQCHSV